MDENVIANLVKKLAEEQAKSSNEPKTEARAEVKSEAKTSSLPKSQPQSKQGRLTASDYPLGKNHPELAKSLTGKTDKDISSKDVIEGSINPEDIRISPEVLEYQAQVAESAGKTQFAMNLRRAAEMTRIPDDEVLELYNMLRPRRSSFEELTSAADRLENKYNARITAKLFREAAEIYKTRSILRT